jgi:hypothetical protein
MSNDDPYVDVATLEIDPDLTPVVLGFNLHFHTVARGSMTVWVDAEGTNTGDC